MSNLRVAKVVEPKDRPSQDEWFRQFNVSTGYVEPYKYFQNNHFDTEVYMNSTQTPFRSMLSGISNIFNIFSWVV